MLHPSNPGTIGLGIVFRWHFESDCETGLSLSSQFRPFVLTDQLTNVITASHVYAYGAQTWSLLHMQML